MKIMIKVLTYIALMALFVSGCKPKGLEGLVPASGQVLYDGNPLEGATVTFSPKSGTGRAATAVTDAKGMFAMGTLHLKDGVAPAEYGVTVTKYVIQNPMTDEEINEYLRVHLVAPEIISKSEIPETYANFSTSGLTVTVPDKGSKNITLELKSQ